MYFYPNDCRPSGSRASDRYLTSFVYITDGDDDEDIEDEEEEGEDHEEGELLSDPEETTEELARRAQGQLAQIAGTTDPNQNTGTDIVLVSEGQTQSKGTEKSKR